MIPPAFEYYAPKTIPEAISLLNKYEDGKVLAGGMSLIPVMKLRLASPSALIDINRIKDLSYIRKGSDGGLEIGALTRYAEIEDSQLIQDEYPMLSEANYVVADIHVRHMGTIGGGVAHGDPAGDIATALIALNAKVKMMGPKGERTINIDDFYVDTFTTKLEHSEIVTAIMLPNLPTNTGTAYQKFSRRSGDFAVVGVAAALTFSNDGRCTAARIAMEAVGPTVLRATSAEKTLVSAGHLTDKVVDEAAYKASTDCQPSGDLLGSEEYKREMIRVYTKRVILAAMARAKVVER